MLCTVDSDVLDLDVAAVSNIEIQEVWVNLGTGKHQRYIPAHLWVLRKQEHYQCFIVLQCVILYDHLQLEGKKHGTYGKCTILKISFP